ncbi:FKBP-type peptidyl-prolyl cis-trans isomerase [Vitiosangium sp. GDMCC 1.1324]|uniref:FKBP-type peptidyl-prolyl cis-trans isomerase n=1 Tax=Vitiosangium sp. (strain GDMCC 1.1324) TaxID=2138576 RepID=UPI000D33BEED|nr:FKBP-type peptidyl-prolyl cis-trans isomerase [Vitiosangium sp. GDMCC 1.1324]PTL75819.1 peptidylprolyl isomerase [Vitiosangium sp. GDMCC 1.1324]
MNRLSLLLSACLLLLVSACGSDSGDPTKVTFAPSLGVDLNAMNRSASGLYTQDLVVGTGTEVTTGRRLQMHYTGWLPDGSMFDTSRDGNEGFVFTLGQDRLIAGWEEGVVGMKVGGKRRLVIPSELGYGESGSPPVIPPNSVLVFDVELLSVR